ncbi:IS30-like element ISBlo4 family transposase [Saccharopolyspora tripterygii]
MPAAAEAARRVVPHREEFRRLRTEGLTRAEAAARVGADERSAQDWDKDVTIVRRGRLYPDGRLASYPDPKMSAVNTPRTARTIDGRVDLDQVEKVIHPRYLSLEEREQIRDLQRTGLSIRKIAAELGRAPSTISREFKRNISTTHGCLPHTAHRLSVQRRGRPRRAKLVTSAELHDYVQGKLNEWWSPEQISNRLIRDFPDAPEMRLSPETIYEALYSQARGGLRRKTVSRLRHGRIARRPRSDPHKRRPRFVDSMTLVWDRPEKVEDRSVPGHWGGDLIIGAASGSAIATAVERSNRFVILGHLGPERSADKLRDRLIAEMSLLPTWLRGPLTWDQGAEMAEHKAFTQATGMPVYFCEPASPWQRGTNENTNGLLRQYFLKGTDLPRHTAEDLAAAAEALNNRPRKPFGWRTPTETLDDHLRSSSTSSVATTS